MHHKARRRSLTKKINGLPFHFPGNENCWCPLKWAVIEVCICPHCSPAGHWHIFHCRNLPDLLKVKESVSEENQRKERGHYNGPYLLFKALLSRAAARKGTQFYARWLKTRETVRLSSNIILLSKDYFPNGGPLFPNEKVVSSLQVKRKKLFHSIFRSLYLAANKAFSGMKKPS